MSNYKWCDCNECDGAMYIPQSIAQNHAIIHGLRKDNENGIHNVNQIPR